MNMIIAHQCFKTIVGLVLLAAGGAVFSAIKPGQTIEVRDSQTLREALSGARPGTTILLAAGRYDCNLRIEGVNGSRDNPIVIMAANPENPPHFSGGNQAIHFVNCNYVTLRHARISGCRMNGINADDKGNLKTPSRGMSFENLIIENIGPKGNHDALKLSGLSEFAVRDSTFSGWGGSAIDMVGCHDGIIENCRFLGKEGFSQDNAVQTKGGSERIIVRRNFFKNAGQRAVNIGGSTGLAFFRPAVREYEARGIRIEGNYFVGSIAPIAYVTATDCHVRYNTIIHPEKWVLRILQEQPTNNFLACQRGVFEHNLIVFDRRVTVFANVGPNTMPETFLFQGNAWFDSQGDRRPVLPVPEIDGIIQVDPDLENMEKEFSTPRTRDVRLHSVGAHAFRP